MNKKDELVARITALQEQQLQVSADLIRYVQSQKPRKLFYANFAADYFNKGIVAAMEALEAA